MAAFEQVVSEFIAKRQREGEKIHTLLTQRLEAINEEQQTVRSKMPEILQWQRERMLQRFEEVQLQPDPTFRARADYVGTTH